MYSPEGYGTGHAHNQTRSIFYRRLGVTPFRSAQEGWLVSWRLEVVKSGCNGSQSLTTGASAVQIESQNFKEAETMELQAPLKTLQLPKAIYYIYS